MNKMPLVSVIIPAYNHEKYVQETVSSIIAQTYQNIELIIIDDGSQDTTWQKILDMEDTCKARFANVDFSTQENYGTCITLNRLLDKTRGEYVYLIASDDKAAPEAIEKEYAFLSENPDYALAVGANDIIDADGRHCFWDKDRNNVYTEAEAEYLSFTDLLIKSFPRVNFFSDDFGSYRLLLVANHIPNGYLIRISIFDKIGRWTPEAPLEDHYLMLQISKYAKMKYIPDTLYYYRWHGANSIRDTDVQIEYAKRTLIYESKTNGPAIYSLYLVAQSERDDAIAERDTILNSRSWRLTKPLREFTTFIKMKQKKRDEKRT